MTDPVPDSVQGAAEPAAAGDDAPKKRPRARRTRGIIAWVLVVLASLLIPISVISAWAITTVTNTDQYVATMAPLARNQVIINHLATKATDELFSTHAVQNKVTDLLPPKAKPIVQPIVTQVKSYVHGVALKVFQSEQFGRLFDALNRRTHQTVVDVLTGKQTKLTKLANDQVVLNLTPQLNQLIDQLNSRGVKLFNPIKPILTNQSGLGLTVVSKSQVSKFSGLFNTLVTLGWAVPVIAVVLGVLGVVVAVQRRKTLLRLAVGVGLFTLLLLGALAWGRTDVPESSLIAPLRRRGGRRSVGHLAALPQGGPPLDAAGLRPRRPRRLAGRPGALRSVDPYEGRSGRSLGGRPGACGDIGGRARRVRISGGPEDGRVDRRARQRPPHPGRGDRRAVSAARATTSRAGTS